MYRSRLLVAGLIATMLAPAVQAQSPTYQTMVLPGVGSVTLTETFDPSSDFWTSSIDYKVVQSFTGVGMGIELLFGGNPGPGFLGLGLDDEPEGQELRGGAVAVIGPKLPGDFNRSFADWYLTYSSDMSGAFIGFLDPDPQLFPVISSSCSPVAPDGEFGLGVPFWGNSFGAQNIYLDTCAPGSYVEYAFDLPTTVHASIVGAPPATVPEPATWLLMGSGLLFIVGLRRRRSWLGVAASR